MLALGWSVYFCFGMVASSLVPIITLLRQDLGISYTQMGIVLGAWQLVYIGAAAPAGLLIDRVGPRKALAVGALVIALSAFYRVFADGFWDLFVAVALFGLGGPIISTGLPKLVADWFVGASRGLASGIYMTGSSSGSMFVLALTHAAILPITGSWRGALFFYAVLAVVVAVAWAILGRDAPSSIARRKAPAEKGAMASYRQVVTQPIVWMIVVVGFAGFLANHGLRNWLPQILEASGLSATTAGLMGALPALTGLVGSIVLLRLASRRPQNRRPVTIGLLIVVGTMTAAIMFTEGWLLVAVIALQGFCAAALIPLMLNTLMETPGIGAVNLGAAAGLFFAIGEVGGTLGPALLGWMADLTGSFTGGVLVLAGVVLVTVFPAWRIRV